VRVSRDKRTVFATGQGGQAGSWPECRDAQRVTPALAPAPARP